MSKAEFSIAYDGPALRDGSMDVRDLAPALLAVGQFFEAANKELNGKRASVRTQVTATKEGSFVVSLALDHSLIQEAIDLFSGDGVTAALQLRELLIGSVIGGGGGVIWLIKWLRGRKPDDVKSVSKGTVRITVEGEAKDVHSAVWKLAGNAAIRRSLAKVVSDPLSQSGVEKFTVSDDGRSEAVHQSESQYFQMSSGPDDPIIDETRRQAFRIEALRFTDGKWRLSDGGNALSARMNDQDFIGRVARNEIAFSKDDVLMCDVRTRQFYEDGTLRTEHSVERVIEHHSAARQLPLAIERDTNDDDA